MCSIEHSNGLCKTGCRSKRRPSTNKTPISHKAVNICDIYMNNFMHQIPNNLTSIEISNLRQSCITDITETGDLQVARGILDLMAVQIGSSNISQTAAIAKDSFIQSTSEVHKMFDLGNYKKKDFLSMNYFLYFSN